MSGAIVDPESSPVRITVQLLPEVARELAMPEHLSQATHALEALLEQTGASIEPVFAGADASDLGLWFTVVAPERTAPELLERLQRHEAVLAAYIKPREALP